MGQSLAKSMSIIGVTPCFVTLFSKNVISLWMNSTILDNTINILLIQFTKLSLKMIQSCNNTPNQSVGNNFHNLFPFFYFQSSYQQKLNFTSLTVLMCSLGCAKIWYAIIHVPICSNNKHTVWLIKLIDTF